MSLAPKFGIFAGAYIEIFLPMCDFDLIVLFSYLRFELGLYLFKVDYRVIFITGLLKAFYDVYDKFCNL